MRKTIWAVWVLFVMGCQSSDNQSSNEPAAIPVTVAMVVAREVHREIGITGIIKAKETVKLSFKLGGKVEEVYFDENDSVKAGVVLARLEQTEINARVTQAEVGVDKAKRDLERIQKLYDDNVIPLAQLQDATSALEKAQADLVIAQYNLDHTELRAPFAGRIAFKLIQESELIGPGTPAFVLVDIREVKVEIGVSDSDIGKIQIGDEAEIRVDSYPSMSFVGVVTRKAIAADQASGTFKVEITVENRDERLLPGMIAQVSIRTQTYSAMFVPIEALSSDDKGQGMLFVVDRNRVHKKEVSVGNIKGNQAEIVEGVGLQDRVVVKGADRVKEGDAVKIINRETLEMVK